MSLFQRLFRKPQVRYEVIRRDVTRLRANEWRTSDTCIGIAQKFLRDPEFWLMLDCVRNDHPDKIFFLKEVSLEERALQQARIEGYMMCLNTLESLGTPMRQVADVRATYESPDADMRPEDLEP